MCNLASLFPPPPFPTTTATNGISINSCSQQQQQHSLPCYYCFCRRPSSLVVINNNNTRRRSSHFSSPSSHRSAAGCCAVVVVPRIASLLWLLVATMATLGRAISVEQCCIAEGVSPVCARTLCNPDHTPNDFALYDIFDPPTNCSRFLRPIAKCLVAGRDHYACCSREAKDLDENACFGLCRGDGDSYTSNSYQTCIAINLASMFACFEKGYATTPSAPRNVVVEQVSATEVELSWEKPEFNAALLDHYLLYIYEMEAGSDWQPDLDTELRVETVNRRAKITLLEPGTRYLAQIIALGFAGNNNGNADQEEGEEENNPNAAIDTTPRSLASEVQFKTAGIAPQVRAYKDKVKAALNSAALIACRIRVSGGLTRTGPNIVWEHRPTAAAADGHFRPIRESVRHRQDQYIFSRFRPREVIGTLQILGTGYDDYGEYKCKVSDDYGQGETTIHLGAGTVQLPLPEPPETPMECCIRNGVEQRCLSMCGSVDVESRRYVPRPFMNQNCSGEISKVLSCAMPSVDDSGCCIAKKIPAQCLYLCDYQQKPSNLMPQICLDYVNVVEQCRIAGIQKRPAPVHGLKAHSSEAAHSVLVRFDPSERADIYYVYLRHRDGIWQHKSTPGTSKKLAAAADELVVVAANPYGFSQPSSLKFHAGKWTRRHHGTAAS